MAWFKKKEPTHVELHHDNRIEVVVNQNATKTAVTRAKEANEYLKSLLDENGVTITITLAAGAKTKRKVSHGH